MQLSVHFCTGPETLPLLLCVNDLQSCVGSFLRNSLVLLQCIAPENTTCSCCCWLCSQQQDFINHRNSSGCLFYWLFIPFNSVIFVYQCHAYLIFDSCTDAVSVKADVNVKVCYLFIYYLGLLLGDVTCFSNSPSNSAIKSKEECIIC